MVLLLVEHTAHLDSWSIMNFRPGNWVSRNSPSAILWANTPQEVKGLNEKHINQDNDTMQENYTTHFVKSLNTQHTLE